MSRTFASILIILALFAAVFGIYLARKSITAAGQGGAATTTTTAITVSEKDITASTTAYEIDVKYPQFGVPAVDSKIAGIVQDAVSQFIADASSSAGQYGQYTLDSQYDSVYTSPSLVSANLIISEYTGGAHPLAAAYGLNYDPATGRALTLEDALAMTGMTLQQVSDEATKQLKDQYGDAIFPEGLAPTTDNYSTFVIDDKNVTFIFQEYQAAAYAAGMPEAVIPRK